jgi:phenylacetate-CoA ligase
MSISATISEVVQDPVISRFSAVFRRTLNSCGFQENQNARRARIKGAPSARRPPGDPGAEGDVGEIVVSLDLHHPWIRLALGDLTAALPGNNPCGRSNMRIKGWMCRADQTTKVKGMFVRPEQIAEIPKRHPELGRLRLVVTREGETDVMTLKAECTSPSDALRSEIPSTLRAVAKLGGAVELVTPGSLPNDGKVIADERG